MTTPRTALGRMPIEESGVFVTEESTGNNEKIMGFGDGS